MSRNARSIEHKTLRLSTHVLIIFSAVLLRFSQPLPPTHINFIGYGICRQLCELYIFLRIVRKVSPPSLSTPGRSSTPLLMAIIHERNSRPRCNYELPKSPCEIKVILAVPVAEAYCSHLARKRWNCFRRG